MDSPEKPQGQLFTEKNVPQKKIGNSNDAKGVERREITVDMSTPSHNPWAEDETCQKFPVRFAKKGRQV